MFCTNCGKQLVDGAYACPYCGNVVGAAVKPQTTYDPYSQPQYNPTTQAVVEPDKPVRTHPLTIVGFVFAFAAPLVGLIISLIARSKIKKDPLVAGARGLNTAGIILSIIFTALWVIYIVMIVAMIAAIIGLNDSNFYMSLFNLL